LGADHIANKAKDQRKKGLPKANFRGQVVKDVTVRSIISKKKLYVKHFLSHHFVCPDAPVIGLILIWFDDPLSAQKFVGTDERHEPFSGWFAVLDDWPKCGIPQRSL
jgi:hypothetical protein